MNKEFIASILQAGVKSDFLPLKEEVNKGVPSLFLLCRLILHYLIEVNVEIKSIIIDSVEIKITQLPNHTTLVLAGSHSFLKAALNTFEIFGSYSRLKMNTNKTKVTWIRRKKYSKDKLQVSVKLDWELHTLICWEISFQLT